MIGKLNKVFASISLLMLFSGLANAQPMKMYSVRNEPMPISNKNTYYILKTTRNCLKCFSELYDLIRSIDTSGSVVLISQVDSSVFARKLEYEQCRKLLPKVNDICFSYLPNTEGDSRLHSMNAESVFERFKVETTPALLIFRGDTVENHSYKEIFIDHTFSINALH